MKGVLTAGHHFHYIGTMERTQVLAALAALAQDSRLDVFRLLVEAGPEGLPAGRIAERLALPSATLSFHLNQLRQAGLVTFRREGRSLIYAAAYAAMNGVIDYLTENCCRGDLDCRADCMPVAPAKADAKAKSKSKPAKAATSKRQKELR